MLGENVCGIRGIYSISHAIVVPRCDLLPVPRGGLGTILYTRCAAFRICVLLHVCIQPPILVPIYRVCVQCTWNGYVDIEEYLPHVRRYTLTKV